MGFLGVRTAMKPMWQCQINVGIWADYDDALTGLLDTALKDGIVNLKIPGWKWRDHTFKLDWQLIQNDWHCFVDQVNDESGKVRAMRRMLVIIDRAD